MDSIHMQYFTVNENGGYDLIIVDGRNRRYCLTKITHKPFGKLLSKEEFINELDWLKNPVGGWLSFLEPTEPYTEVDYLEPVTKLQEYVLGEAVISQKISAGKIMAKYGVDKECAISLMDWMERKGFISPEINCEHRVLMSQNDYIGYFMV